MRLKVSLPTTTPSLNKLLRTHYRERKRMKKGFEWELLVVGACEPQYKVNGMKKRYVHIKSFRARLLDQDNFVGGLKVFLDALTELELIHDDSPEYLELRAEQIKAGKVDQRLEITIEDTT
jgi:Holliday junction resolvase RusA-like endonuclease